MKRTPRLSGYSKQLLDPVREALQVLEHAELVIRRAQGGGSGAAAWLKATRLGETALAEGTVKEHLQAR